MKKNAFTLIEVLVFTTILNIFFVAVIAVSLAALRNIKFNENKTLAARYAEELESWLRSQKDSDWTIFTSQGGNTYCFNTTPIGNIWPSAGACSSNGLIPQIYKREVSLTNSGSPPTSSSVLITVKWDDLGSTRSVLIKTVFSIYER
ncbi:MAG: type II secretion system protein [Candidatus Roizmanbacteria bacterium]|nr:MAG: type II secretion system protein [Candidatus Roizmanbacteria bacterium]